MNESNEEANSNSNSSRRHVTSSFSVAPAPTTASAPPFSPPAGLSLDELFGHRHTAEIAPRTSRPHLRQYPIQSNINIMAMDDYSSNLLDGPRHDPSHINAHHAGGRDVENSTGADPDPYVVAAVASASSCDSWHFTDFDKPIGPLSRDGSIHATDEIINSATHLAASMFSLLGTVLLISESSAQGNPWKIVSFSIYGASLLFLFVCSTLHHAVTASASIELRLRMLDYLAIYPLIAGTFTPLCLVYYHDSVIGWSFCGVVWSMALLGMFMTLRMFTKIPKWMSTTMYVTLGWLGAFMTKWLLPKMGWGGIAMFVGGGVLYTVGGIVFSAETPNPIPGKFGFHEIWHLAVMSGAGVHWCMMYYYVLPY